MDNARVRYAVALISGDNERIMGVFNTKAEADAFGNNNKVPREFGLQLCYSALFAGEVPMGNSMSIYGYYNHG